MAVNLKSERTDRLARELAALTGEGLTEAVTIAITERLDRERHQRRTASRRSELERITAHYATLPRIDQRSADDILGYDANGLPT